MHNKVSSPKQETILLTKKYIQPQLWNKNITKDKKPLSQMKKTNKIGLVSLWLTGFIKNKNISSLVDSENTHNLIHIKCEK